MIVVTGAAGFIGSCLIAKLNKENYNYIVAVDKFDNPLKMKNLEGKKIQDFVDRDNFESWLETNQRLVEFVIHLGARTDTTEFNKEIFDKLNLNYSKTVWNQCAKFQIPLIYASSAATYGLGEYGYDDDETKINHLKPLNPYGDSKNDFDKWALQQTTKPFFWAGLKFFNVYGPNEYHKSRMASVIFHAFNQINEKNEMKLFKSHNPNFSDGGQMRDFVYVKDVVEVIYYLIHHRKNSGIYNLGSGKARTFNDLVSQTFKSLNKNKQITYIDTPIDIRDKYQYFTEANMNKLHSIGYFRPFYTLEEGVDDYITNYLVPQKTL
ncbi:MAG: ADP-glyceromanno-heptose 6-epimerase [Cytophagales bacterium]